ncbi:MAG: methyl-accepting chemotaxis protein [Candidatus Magnetoglobus multicellularis str. Araruama]|uniref:Methyl-accepting chemotaxis protein n=1 Tax=Candidatus Magnetoglobus multicellularis str. Araruama TaxID=890399 RepID=A0A1V1P9Z6_9BACT|nr:MAG: methyl-accepting chemotaxis protein [Candidatus Magnetoglobus multicellularis str. Araruama]
MTSIWLAHPDPSFLNQDFSKKVDPEGNPILPPMLKMAKESGEGYHSYLGRRPNDKDYQNVHCYFEYIPEWEWLIGSSFYDDQIEKGLKERKASILIELRHAFTNISIGKSGYLFLFNHQGKILIHPYLETDTDVSGIVNKATGHLLFNELIESSKTPETPILYLWDKPTQRGEFKFWKYGYTYHYKPLNWYLTATFFKNEIDRPAHGFIRKFLLLSFIFSLLIILLFGLFVSSISTPILRLASCIHEMGNNNLFANLPAKDLNRKDELGTIARGYEATRSYLSKIIAEMNQHAKTVAKASENFSQGAKEQLQLAEKMDEQSHVTVQCSENNLKHIQLITNETELGARDVNAILDRINQLSNNINSVAESAALSSSNMTDISKLVIDVSDDIYQVTESIENMAGDLTSVFKNSSDNVAISKKAETQITSSLGALNKLQEASENINNAVQLISAISSQTNLLALNATIEAVHAGEAGEGFAVVAEEVKVLASKTNDANDQIRKLIIKIREYIEATIQSIHETSSAIKSVVDNNVLIGQSIERQRDVSKNLSEVIESISTGARESAQKARDSDARLKEVTFFTTEVADLARDSAQSVAQTAARIKDIAESSDVVLSGIQTSNSNIIKINEYSGNITKVAKNNNRNAQELIKMTEALDKIVTIFNTCNISEQPGKTS